MPGTWRWFIIFWMVVGLMSGPISVIRELLALYRGQQASPTAFWRWAWIAFVVSAFIVWSSEYLAKRSALRQLEAERDRNTPKLLGSIEAINVGIAREQNVAMLIMWVSIRSVGMDSIARYYKLKVLPGDGGAPIEMNLAQLPARINFTNFGISMTGPMVSIFDKTAESPIPRGGSRNGVLMFFAPPGITKESLVSTNTRYILSFQDVLERPYEATYVWANQGLLTEPMYMPGTPHMTRTPEPEQ